MMRIGSKLPSLGPHSDFEHNQEWQPPLQRSREFFRKHERDQVNVVRAQIIDTLKKLTFCIPPRAVTWL